MTERSKPTAGQFNDEDFLILDEDDIVLNEAAFDPFNEDFLILDEDDIVLNEAAFDPFNEE